VLRILSLKLLISRILNKIAGTFKNFLPPDARSFLIRKISINLLILILSLEMLITVIRTFAISELSTVGILKNLSPRVLEIFQPEIKKNLNFSNIDLEHGILITYVKILETLSEITNRTSTFSC